jgi:hypothetical protein
MKVSFCFTVEFCGNFDDELDVTSDHHELILDWYNKHGKYMAKHNDMTNVVFKFLDTQVVECSYELSDELYSLYKKNDDLVIYQMGIADPDDDGNSPVEIDGNEWLIRGITGDE